MQCCMVVVEITLSEKKTYSNMYATFSLCVYIVSAPGQPSVSAVTSITATPSPSPGVFPVAQW